MQKERQAYYLAFRNYFKRLKLSTYDSIFI